MKKFLLCSLITLLVLAVTGVSFSEEGGTKKILKEGLVGAGAGAVGGAASGAKGGELWKGALAGAGVNIVGSAILDSLTGEKVGSTEKVDKMDSRGAYKEGYGEGFTSGYKQGYNEGFKEGVKTASE